MVAACTEELMSKSVYSYRIGTDSMVASGPVNVLVVTFDIAFNQAGTWLTNKYQPRVRKRRKQIGSMPGQRWTVERADNETNAGRRVPACALERWLFHSHGHPDW